MDDMDWTVPTKGNAASVERPRVRAARRVGGVLALMAALLSTSTARAITTPELLDALQHTAFNYFWNEANPANGLVRDRSTPT